jgi:hypothetical protein
MADNTVVIFKGSDEQPLNDQIIYRNRPLSLATATVKFRMRPADSDDLKVDESANVDDSEKGLVSYEWTDADLDTAGEFFGWWHVELTGGGDFDTPEFFIVVTEHAPGQRTRTGDVARIARSIIPITWDKLEDSQVYGDRLLQDTIEAVKKSLLVATVLPEDEKDLDIRVVRFLAKLSVLQVIPAGVDYWMNQHQSISTTGTQESVSYPNRIDALWKIHERLLIEVTNEQGEIEAILGTTTNLVPRIGVPGVSPGTQEGFKTPLPSGDNFIDYAFPQPRNGWPW